MPLLDGEPLYSLDDPELDLVRLRAQEAGSRIVSRRLLAGLIPAALLNGIFALSSLAVALGIP